MLRDVKRVLVLPLNYDHPQEGMVEAFRQVFGDVSVSVFDYLFVQKQLQGSAVYADAEFFEVATRLKPDWIFMQLQETGIVTPATIGSIKLALPNTVITQWNGDYRPELGEYQKSIARACDLTLLSSRGQLADYTRAGARDVAYCQIGLDWSEDVLGKPAWQSPFEVPEIVFIGNYYEHGPWKRGTAERLDAVKRLNAVFGARFGVVGSGWPAGTPVIGACTVKQQHHVWKRAKVAINVNHENHVESYYSDRLLIALASGTPVVTYKVPGLDREFDVGEELLAYDETLTDDDLVNCVDFLLTHPSRAREIGMRGRLRVMREHSWYARILQILPTIQGLE